MITPLVRTLGPLGRAYGVVDPNADLKALVDVYYKLNEASGQRNDSGPNVLHLTDNNTVGQTTGLVYANAALFVAANEEYFSGADHDALDLVSSKTLEAWFWMDAARSQFLIGKLTAVGAGEWYVISNSDASIKCGAWNASVERSALNTAILTLNAWHHGLFWYDFSDQRVHARIDNGTVLNGTFTGVNPVATTEVFGVGGYGNGSAIGSRWGGRIGPAAQYNGVLTTGQQDRLWNGGAGLALYP